MSGRGTSRDDISRAGFGTGGAEKRSLAANMLSHADRTGEGKALVSELQRCGARGEGFTGDDISRSAMDNPGFGPDGVDKNSLDSQTVNETDKSGAGDEVKAPLPSTGARK